MQSAVSRSPMMSDRSTEPVHGPATDDRLDSWKEIASYLKKGVRTVQRWEQNEGLPVRRLSADRRGMVFAYRSEIDAWWTSRGASLSDSGEHEIQTPADQAPESVDGAHPSSSSVKWVWVAAACVALAALALSAWNDSPPAAPPAGGGLLASAPLTSATGVEQHPAFSADGRRIAYSSNPDGLMGFDIYVQSVQGRDAVQLTRHPAPDFHPAWSPDGRRIAFMRVDYSGGASGVYVVPTAGGAETKIADLPLDMPFAYLINASWAQSGEHLYISRILEGHAGLEIALLDAASGKAEPLSVSESLHYDLVPRLSPDGSRLAFLRASTKSYPSAIVIQPVGADGRTNGEASVIPADREMVSLDWTPDGRDLVFIGRSGGNWGLWRVDSENRRPPRPLTGPGLNVTGVAVSAAAGRLVYETEQADSNLWRLDTESGHYEQFLASTYSDREAAFSPDGARIAFLSARTGAEQVWVAGADGSEASPVTAIESGVLATPAWSPDSKRVVFARAVGKQSEIWIADVAQRSAERLLTEDGMLASPIVSRDGRSIFFSSDREGPPRIWRMPVAGGDIEPLGTEHGRYVMQSPDGRSLYYAAHDGDALVRKLDLDSGQEEAVTPALPMGAGLTVGQDGFYWMPLRKPGEPIDIRFRRFDGTGERLLARIPKLIQPGLAVSPDGRSVLYTQMDQFGSDLNIVEDFK